MKQNIDKGIIRSKKNKKTISFSIVPSLYYRVKLLKLKTKNQSRVVLSGGVEKYLFSLIKKIENELKVDTGDWYKYTKAIDKQEGKPCPINNCGGKKKIIFYKGDDKTEKVFVGCTNHPHCKFSEKIYN